MFSCMCPNRREVGVIENHDEFEHVFDLYKYYVCKALKEHSITAVHKLTPLDQNGIGVVAFLERLQKHPIYHAKLFLPFA